MQRLFIVLLLVFFVIAIDSMAAVPTAYVINTSGETLSKIDLTSGTVTNDILPIGSDLFSFPNQIIVRDSLAYVVASGTDEIHVINLNTESTVGFMPTGDGSNPYWMAFYDNQYAYVSLLVSSKLLKVDVQSLAVVDTVDLPGKSPEGVAIHDDKVYVALTGFDFGTFLYDPGQVAVFDATADTLLYEIPVGINPQFVDVDRNGDIHVMCTGDFFSVFGRAYVIDGATDVVTDSLELGGSPGMLHIGPENIVAVAAGGFTTDGFVYSYSASSLDVYYDSNAPLAVDSGCVGVTWFQDSTFFATSFKDVVERLDSGGASVAAYGLGDGPVHVDFNYQPGDMNGDWTVDPVDLSYLVDYLFATGDMAVWPIWRGDVNADGALMNPVDLAYLVDFFYAGGSAPQHGIDWLR